MENKDNKELFNDQEEIFLKKYFHKLDQSLGVERETPPRLQIVFNQKLDKLINPMQSNRLNWKSLSLSLAGAFSVGVILARFVLLPTEVATRSVGQINSNSYIDKNPPIVVIAAEPDKLVISAIEASFNTDLEVTTFKAGNKIQVIVKPLRPYSKEQKKIKDILNLKEDLSGEVTVIVKSEP
jgi:hypothetical protein